MNSYVISTENISSFRRGVKKYALYIWYTRSSAGLVGSEKEAPEPP